MNRRELMSRSAALGLGVLLTEPGQGRARPLPNRMLFFTKSSGYEHSVIKQNGEQPSHAAKVLQELGAAHGWDVTHTKDGRVFTKAGLRRYDAVFFYTTGDLTTPGKDQHPPMTREGLSALLEAIQRGLGFVGAHCATDTFHSPVGQFEPAGDRADPYIRMIGAEFIQHGQQQTARIRCADPRFPGCAELKNGFELMEEWYSFKDYQKDLHVILVQETAGMVKAGADRVYDRPPYPATWARWHGKGRVFYTSMGHREDVWTDSRFQSLLAGGIAWVSRQVEADVTPNLDRVAPGYAALPPAPEP